VPLVVGLALAFVLAFLYNAGAAAGHALWLPVVLGVLAFLALAHWTWHRRALAELQHREANLRGHWHQLEKLRAWPKWCDYCGVTVYNYKQVNAHDSITSPCVWLADLRAAEDAAELDEPATLNEQPGMNWKVDAFQADPEPVDKGAEAIEGPQ